MHWIVFASLTSVLLAFCSAAPPVSLVSNSLLDSNGVFFVSFDGVVNVNSFQLTGVLAHGNFQFAAWYTSSRAAILARRQLPSGSWSTLQLPHNLSTNDSHNVIALGISPSDGKIHVALDCHSTQVFYTVSEANLASSGVSWVASRFGTITTTIGNLNVGTSVDPISNVPYFPSEYFPSGSSLIHNSWSLQTTSCSLSIDLGFQEMVPPN